jgi:hypothetical protein
MTCARWIFAAFAGIEEEEEEEEEEGQFRIASTEADYGSSLAVGEFDDVTYT